MVCTTGGRTMRDLVNNSNNKLTKNNFLNRSIHDSWLTKEQDMNTAHNILSAYYEDYEQEVDLEAVKVTQEGSILIERAEWIIELEDTMEEKYGADYGELVSARVMTILLSQGEAIH